MFVGCFVAEISDFNTVSLTTVVAPTSHKEDSFNELQRVELLDEFRSDVNSHVLK